MDTKYSFNLFKLSITIFIFLTGLLGLVPVMARACNSTDINDFPMETAMASAPANVMFLFDDSGSMDWEFMTPENEGLFHADPQNYPKYGREYYIFPANSYSPYTDHHYYDSKTINESQRRIWKYQWSGYNKLYYDPRQVYVPWPGAAYGDANTTLPRSNPINASPVFNLADVFRHLDSYDFSDSRQTATQAGCGQIASEVERIYDDDYVKIVLDTNGTLTVQTLGCTDTVGRILDSAGNPYRTSEYRDPQSLWFAGYEVFADDCGTETYCDTTCYRRDRGFYIKLNNVPAGTYYIHVRGYLYITGMYTLSISFTGTCGTPPPPTPTPATPVTIYNAHYFAWDDSNGNGNPDNLEVYLVNFEDSDGDGVLDVRKYYQFDDQDGDDIVGSPAELTEVSDIPQSIKAVKRDVNGNIMGYMTPEEELQNFANWFSYYRRRELTAKAGVSMAIDQLQNVNSGLYTINERVIQPVLFLDSTNRNTLLSELFSINSGGYTPLRQALKNVGRYFDADDGYSGHIGSAPWASEADGGGCQQAFSIVMTDGYWNGSYSPHVGNADGDDGAPFADTYSNTLADVARYYYENDLNSSLPDEVPANDCDSNHKQHMVTYGLSFGVKGELSPNYDAYHECMLDVINGAPGAPPAPAWEDPFSCDSCGKKIDDLWHAAVNGRGTFMSAGNPQEFIDALSSIVANISGRAASGAAVSINSEKLTTNTILFQATYESGSWTGDLVALTLDALTGDVSNNPIWSSKTKLLDQDWDTGRRIITSDGSSAMPFRYNSLTAGQKSLINNNSAVVDFIRGAQVSGMRNRPLINGKVDKLGDLVHSAPTLVNNTIFVGGNDGMLHAFDAGTGEERFGFVPYSVFPKLEQLTDPGYTHTFYVDLTPTVKLNVPGGRNILVGGLGAGGKGYFALDITGADSITAASTESSVQSMFMWEYPGQNSDPDLGVSMSKVSIVRSHSTSHPWVAIFGNGYDSNNGRAVLYVLDLFTGDVVTKIDTGAGNCNGLSTPAVVDVDGDFVADYVYAGDLKGNMWKFDITADSETQWGSAYGTHPLFKAEGQAITAKPDVMRHCVRHGYMVIFGTGKYMGLSDISSSSQETVYGIWDYGDAQDEYVGSFNASSKSFTPSGRLAGNDVELIEQVISDAGDYRTSTDNSANWSVADDPDPDSMPDPKGTSNYKATVGWYANFITPGERVARDIIIRNGYAIVITVTPNSSPCSGGGSSVLYEFKACDGAAPGSPVFDVDEDGTLDENDEVGGDYPTGKEFTTIVHDPVFLRLPDNELEFKYFSTAQGTIERVREPADYLGIYYWIEW